MSRWRTRRRSLKKSSLTNGRILIRFAQHRASVPMARFVTAASRCIGAGRDVALPLLAPSSSVIATLLDIQFSQRGPLMRTTALSGLPRPVRSAMVARSNRIARRYGGMMSDGIAAGSIRPIDPLIAAQALMALQNAAFDMRKWAGTMPRDRAVAFYASTLCFGLFDDRVLGA